jgi:hypothetical protein
MSTLNVTNIKAADGATGMSIANSTGVVTFNNPPVNVGVSNLQMFRVNANQTSTTSPTTITAWTDGHGTQTFSRIGNAWSVSSGVFTPSVSGFYEIAFAAELYVSSAARYIQFDYHFSTNSGGAYTVNTMYGAIPYISDTTYSNFNFPRYYNITNAANFRFQLKFSAAHTGVTMRGGATNDISQIVFKRLADAQ